MISLALVILAAIAKSVMDTLKFRFFKSVFDREGKWWYKYAEPKSWLRKWKNGDVKQGEAYWLSSTVLVFTTDIWHMCQMVMKTALIVAIFTYRPILTWYWDLAIFLIAFSLVFEIFFSKIWIKWKK